MGSAKRTKIAAIAPASKDGAVSGGGGQSASGQTLRIDGVIQSATTDTGSTEAGAASKMKVTSLHGAKPSAAAASGPAEQSDQKASGQATLGQANVEQAKIGMGGIGHASPTSPASVSTSVAGRSSIIKLGGAAAGLAAIALVLMVMQFGSDPVSEGAESAPRVAQLLTPQALAGLEPTATSEQRAAAAELLSVAVETAAPLNEQDALVAQMTAGTLAALRSGGADQTAAAAPATQAVAPETAAQPHTALYGMVLRAVGQGQSPEYIDQLVNEAYRAQSITVPAALIDANGRVDTTTILALFLGQ
ncbi:hypothetical protein [Phaeobacter sp.]|uniref:hypothetical protein n=1 Tax=Phaeobacter sp. TaxID=1902409 RepID=UPI0025F46B7F|nr:hypothetical protein [Phaeobacter sp.]